MAFDDFPIVDSNSKVSEESVLSVKLIFSQKNGFITRTPIPDLGVDLEVELILEETNPSGYQFPIQIKSSQDILIVEHNGAEFVSYPFETSRIGYLCRKTPAFGLIVVYDDVKRICYYDYVEDIVPRATEQRGSDDWKNQEKININIPVGNILTKGESQKIFEKFKRKFENFKLLIKEHGPARGIPCFFNEERNRSIDSLSPDEVVDFLEKQGPLLFNEQAFSLIIELLGKVTFHQIIQSSKLLFLAAISNEISGRYIDAEYFINKSLVDVNQYSINDRNLLLALKAHLDYTFGNITILDYRQKLEELLKNIDDGVIKITLRLRILHIKIAERKIYEDDFTKLLVEVDELVDLVERSISDEALKHHYKIGLATQLIEIMGSRFSEITLSFKHRGRLFGIPVSEKSAALETLNAMLTKAFNFFKKALEYAKKGNNTFLIACASYASALSECILNYQELMVKDVNEYVFDEKNFRRQFSLLTIAYKTFLKDNLLDHAYKALSTAFDVNKINLLIFKREIENVNGKELESQMRELEKRMGKEKYTSIIDTIQSVKKSAEQLDPGEEIVNLADNEIEKYANYIRTCFSLPEDRLNNIIFDLKFLKAGYSVLKHSNFEIIQNLNHTQSPDTFYKERPTYILKCKKCGFCTKPGNDLEELLRCKSSYHSFVCL